MNDHKPLTDDALAAASGGMAATKPQFYARHTVVKGETLQRIADRYKTNVASIEALNPFIRAHQAPPAGWMLTVPDNR